MYFDIIKRIIFNKYFLISLICISFTIFFILQFNSFKNKLIKQGFESGKKETEQIWEKKYSDGILKIQKENKDRLVIEQKEKQVISKKNADLEKKINLDNLKIKKLIENSQNLNKQECELNEEEFNFLKRVL